MKKEPAIAYEVRRFRWHLRNKSGGLAEQTLSHSIRRCKGYNMRIEKEIRLRIRGPVRFGHVLTYDQQDYKVIGTEDHLTRSGRVPDRQRDTRT